MSFDRTIDWPPAAPTAPLAVLVSGGLDSAVLLAEALRVYPVVHPIYVRTGLFWEEVERRWLDRFLEAIHRPNLAKLTVLDQPTKDVYGRHWSVTGLAAPAADAPNDADFLPGRNVLLFAKPLIWCHLNEVPDLATGPLASNPFPDATPEFYDDFAAVVSRGLAGSVRIVRPYAHLHKDDVIRRGREFPLHLTFTCIRPAGEAPCGVCIKCGERQRGFRAAGVPDPTPYASKPCSA
ncbi:MAG TPA: 7-cyano-7-deazaguanine synthase [Urbifossiella sp.]|nr:7-cyano-7-deazaguanine synthase [Urbifossiella sp.]